MACVLAATAAASPRRTLDSQHFMLYYDEGQLYQAEAVRQSAEAAFLRIQGLLGWSPTDHIPIYLYSDRGEFRRDAGIKRQELVVGVATSADSAIRIDASEIFASVDSIIGHELTHIFLFRYLGSAVQSLPLWMNEGLAQEAGGSPRSAAGGAVVTAYKEQRLYRLEDLRDRFPRDDTGHVAYDEAQDVVGYLLDRGGWPRIRAVLNQLKQGLSFEVALHQGYGIDVRELDGAWRADVKSRARPRVWGDIGSGLIVGAMLIALSWGYVTVQRKRKLQALAEAPPVEDEYSAPPVWWPEDQFKV